MLTAAALPEPPSLLVADVSFIGVLKAVGPVLPLQLAPGADVIVLVNPQFEVGPAKVGKGGIVDRNRRRDRAQCGGRRLYGSRRRASSA